MEQNKPLKVLVLNGSPKGDNSSTMYVTKAFVDGIKEVTNASVEYVNINSLNVKPCIGCLSCWARTEGECIIRNDDIVSFKEKILNADIFIESFPLYFFGMPGTVKVFTDRMLSMMNTYRGHKPPMDGSSLHGLRYENKDHKFVLISSCAYTQTDMVYDSLRAQYDFICGKDGYTPIFVSQLKTLIELKNENKINRFLDKFKEAGKEFVRNGFLSEETKENLKKPPFSEGAYQIFLNNFWTNEKNS